MTERQCATLPPGRYGDGLGLQLQVRSERARAWIFRYRDASGKDRHVGLGQWPVVSLEEARAAALDMQRMRRDGRDPFAERKAADARVTTTEMLTFKQAAAAVIDIRRPTWSNDKHAAQWETSLATYAYPKLGDVNVSLLDTGHFVDVLTPLWVSKMETARRLQQRLSAVMEYAAAKGLRSGANPASLEALKDLLPDQKTIRTKNADKAVQHHAALPWQDVPAFLVDVRQREALAARALELAALTALRTGNIIGARWADIDLEQAVWRIPAAQMKARSDHLLPLSKQAVALLKALPRTGELVFEVDGKPMSNGAMLALLKRMKRTGQVTTHGFRSSFMDWTGEATNHEIDAARAQLAHNLGDKVRLAYQRGTLLQKREQLVQDWADFCDGKAIPSKVVNIDRGAA
ncbi:integrase family protein [Cupriavidus sp. HMR-1]|nr:integrase family protein [Cupriavidus sp. HMR-1]